MSHVLPPSRPPIARRPGGFWAWLALGFKSARPASRLARPDLLRQACRLGVCLLLTGTGGAAYADWTFLAVKDGVTYLVDRNSIANAGPYKRIWMLQNYPQPFSYGAQSLAMLMEVECPKYRVRFNQLVAHAGQHLSGTLLETITQPGPWEGISPGPFRSVYDLLCRTNDPRFDPQPPPSPQPAKR